jgi:hypothetical protein
MTYDYRPDECSGYCSSWQSFRLNCSEVAPQLQPLESPLHRFRGWMDMPLRKHDATVTGKPHDGESVHSHPQSLISIVWRSERITKSAGKIARRFTSILETKTPRCK